MVAERETNDRFTAVFLANKVGEIFQAKVSGVTRAGLFLSFDDTGADALVPISSLGNDFFNFDADKHMLVGKRTGETFRLADRLSVRLREVDIVTGSMIAEVIDGRDGGKTEAGSSRRPPPRRSAKPDTTRNVKKKKRTLPKGKKRAQRRKEQG